ncbi:D-aminoacylase [Vibrio maritimus]|uniref:D-aminoacylase n=1 Tax=Vibrio maritimus TaxID=990268 RepID=A0A090TBQ5_9VIBR|nr:D-aminoacylase [Vibrio maritimus]
MIVGNCGISASPATLHVAPPDPMNLLGKQEDFKYQRLQSTRLRLRKRSLRLMLLP